MEVEARRASSPATTLGACFIDQTKRGAMAETSCTNVVLIVEEKSFNPTAGILAPTRLPDTSGNSALQPSTSMSGSIAPEHRNNPCKAVDQEALSRRSQKHQTWKLAGVKRGLDQESNRASQHGHKDTKKK